MPTLADLTKDKEVAKNTDKFNFLMNQDPPEKWVKEHPVISGHLYVPIDKIEHVMKRVFKEYRFEIKETKMMMNAVVVTVRVHYKHPVTNEWNWQDGIGAEELQTEKNSGALKADMSNVKRGALPMAAPIAEVTAIKDACHKIGRLFGSDLNRKDVAPYKMDDELQKEPVDGEDWEMLKESVKLGRMSAVTANKRYDLTDEQREKLYDIEEGNDA